MHPLLLDPPYSSGGGTDNEPYELVLEPQSTLSDDLSSYKVSELGDEGDNIVAYDTETSHHTTVTNRHQLRKKQHLRCEHNSN